jgi:2-keto-4-pentenoate hydratase/2-oxohepta-3-ene-1,7-dioic acid hydratase in catechol pathway
MKIARFSSDGHHGWGIVDGDTIRVAPASITLDDAIRDRRALDRSADDSVDRVAVDSVQLMAPLPAPTQFIGIGMNYRDHAAEVGALVSDVPVTFGFYTNSVVGPGAPIQLPPFSQSVDWEVELAIVIGAGGRDIPPEHALDAVAGYTIVNDVSARDIQFSEGQWGRAKSFDSFKPMGPWIVTVDELGDAAGLALSLRVNGEVKQASTTDHLIFDVRYLVSHLSRSFTLLPGSVIATGTPGGVGFSRTPPEFLAAGDIVEAVVEGIGCLSNPVIGSPQSRVETQAEAISNE